MTVTGEFFTLRIMKDPPKRGGLDCVFRRFLLDLQATSDLRSHDSELVTEGVPQPDP